MTDQKQVSVLHFTTSKENCGIARFQDRVIARHDQNQNIKQQVFGLSPNQIKNLPKAERLAAIQKLVDKAKKFDIVHIQHEFGLFYGGGEGFSEIVNALKSQTGAKIIVTIHTAPGLVLRDPVPIQLSRPLSLAANIKTKISNKKALSQKVAAFKDVDTVVTFNQFTADQLSSLAGVDSAKVYKTLLPPYVKHKPSAGSRARIESFFKHSKPKILATAGFISDKKGVDQAIKALKFLPEEYVLLVIGGSNPANAHLKGYTNAITDLILSNDLSDRVHITGFIEDDNEMLDLLGATDGALYPYDVDYYKMVSSDAINTALCCDLPIVAYPAPSFKELNAYQPGMLSLTQSPDYYEIANLAIELRTKDEQAKLNDNFRKNHGIDVFALGMEQLYQGLISQK